jgi:hypothetical protein
MKRVLIIAGGISAVAVVAIVILYFLYRSPQNGDPDYTPRGSIVCPGMPPDQFCDTEGDCVMNPSIYCQCPEAVAACKANGHTVIPIPSE